MMTMRLVPQQNTVQSSMLGNSYLWCNSQVPYLQVGMQTPMEEGQQKIAADGVLYISSPINASTLLRQAAA
jgi:hypothetical protein